MFSNFLFALYVEPFLLPYFGPLLCEMTHSATPLLRAAHERDSIFFIAASFLLLEYIDRYLSFTAGWGSAAEYSSRLLDICFRLRRIQLSGSQQGIDAPGQRLLFRLRLAAVFQ